MLSLGPYKFASTSLKYSRENRWSTIECIENMPLLQNIGQGVENIDLEGMIYLHNLNVLNQLRIVYIKETRSVALINIM
ncbi:phage tail protein [Wolbachia endosymbiont of Drosophila nikananu]|nr:phage tail protein [Wolbachia endosymbiont of Drosophila nikananu]MDE5061268.1 phage tail protein [Wolbachia endosymbiont of Drosophila nikananu]